MTFSPSSSIFEALANPPPKISPMNTFSGARVKWAEVFEDSNLTLDSLKARALSQQSNLGIDGIRSVCWKIYLSCLPTLDLATWPLALDSEREKYVALRRQFIKTVGSGEEVEPDLEVNNPLSLAEDSPWQQFFVDSELKKIIQQDVERTFPDNDYFRSESVQEQLGDILFIYCKINHDVSYRQGMHELLAHILWVVSSESLDVESASPRESDATSDVMKTVLDSRFIEHDTFALFSSLMSRAKPWYEFSDEGFGGKKPKPNNAHNTQLFGKPEVPEPIGKQTPVIEWSLKIFHHLERVDPELYLHLTSLEIQPQLFGIRWFRLLFGREFPMEDVLNLWDGIFAKDPSLNICIFIGLALLLRIRDELLEEDFAGCLHKLMRYPSVKDIHLFIPQALRLQKLPNGAGGQEIIRQNNILAGKPVPALPAARAEADHTVSHHQPQQQQHQQHHKADGRYSPTHHSPQSQHHHHHQQQYQHQDQTKSQGMVFPGNGVLSQHLPPAALDAIKPMAEGFVHVTKNVLESKGGAALNKAIHDMKKNTQSYIRKANATTPPAATPNFPPMFDQAIASSGRLAAASRPAPSPQKALHSNSAERQLDALVGQVVAKAVVIFESEFFSPAASGERGASERGQQDQENNQEKESEARKDSLVKVPSKEALAALSGLKHVRDFLLGLTREFDALVVESGMLEPSEKGLAKKASVQEIEHTAKVTEPARMPAAVQSPSRPKTSTFYNSSGSSGPDSDTTTARTRGARSPVTRAANPFGGDLGKGVHHTTTIPHATIQTALPVATPAPVPVLPPPPPPKPSQPFSFDDLIKDTSSEGSGMSDSGSGSKGRKSQLANSGLTQSLPKSSRSSLAHSQFSWMLDGSANDQGNSDGLSGSKSGSSVSLGRAGGSELFSPLSGSGRMKLDPLAGHVSQRMNSGASLAGQGPSSGEDPLS